MSNGNGYYSSDEGWQTPNSNPFKQVQIKNTLLVCLFTRRCVCHRLMSCTRQQSKYDFAFSESKDGKASIQIIRMSFLTFMQTNGDQMNGLASDRTRKSAQNGKSKGFGNFFKRGSGKKEKSLPVPGVHTLWCHLSPSSSAFQKQGCVFLSCWLKHDRIHGHALKVSTAISYP